LDRYVKGKRQRQRQRQMEIYIAPVPIYATSMLEFYAVS
jgi:hypothetical protein